MAKIGTLLQKAVSATLNFGDGDIVKVKFKPHDQMQNEAKNLQDKADADPNSEEVKKESYVTFCRTFTEWDLQDNDGNVIPLTPDGLNAANCGGEVPGVPVTLLTDFIIRAYESYYTLKTHGRRN